MMPSKLFTLSAGIVALGAVIGLTATNPTTEHYEAFAVQQARSYLKTEVCPEELPLVGRALEADCKKFLDSEAATPQLKTIIAEGTDRQNFLLFSLYRTELAIENVFPLVPAGLLPAYEIKSVGLLRSLHIYEAESL